jgi:hypothetical protein
MRPTAAQILEQARQLDENERRELALELLDTTGLLGEIVDAAQGDDAQLAASERDFAEGRVHSNADALRQLREHVERIAGSRNGR